MNNAGLVVGAFGGSHAQRSYVYDVATQQYTAFLTATVPGCVVTGINNAGTVCGYRRLPVAGDYYTAFRWTASDGFVDLGLQNGASTRASDINLSGACTGTMRVNGVSQPFIWRSNGELIPLGCPGGLEAFGRAISEGEAVVGWETIAIPVFPWFIGRGVRWSNGGVTLLTPLSGCVGSAGIYAEDGGISLGTSRDPTVGNVFRATLWSNAQAYDLGSLAPFAGYIRLWAVAAISDNGVLLADVSEPDGDEVAVLLTPDGHLGDIDLNCVVDVVDLLSVIVHWGNTSSPADITQDGIVNQLDLLVVIDNWD